MFIYQMRNDFISFKQLFAFLSTILASQLTGQLSQPRALYISILPLSKRNRKKIIHVYYKYLKIDCLFLKKLQKKKKKISNIIFPLSFFFISFISLLLLHSLYDFFLYLFSCCCCCFLLLYITFLPFILMLIILVGTTKKTLQIYIYIRHYCNIAILQCNTIRDLQLRVLNSQL